MAMTAMPEPTDSVEAGTADLLAAYRLMLLMRRFEESLYRKYREGRIGGYLHRYDGQEALVAGVIPQLVKGDYVLCTYRDHAHALACGTEPRAIMAELLGRATGCAGGKGGSMHLIDPANGFLGGDGAMNQGGVHEALNLAGLYGLPIVFVLENNGYAMGTSVVRSTGQPDLLLKAEAHGIEAERVDGMDFLAVHAAACRAIRKARDERRAQFLEMRCYRFVGHGVADNAQQQRFYRTEEEIAEWKGRDPLARLRNFLGSDGRLTDGDEETMESEIKATIEDAIRFAEASPAPSPDALYDHVFAEG
jgi:pyruvate dehydrogenase E1 component alpha subunit